MPSHPEPTPLKEQRFGCLHVLLLVTAAVVVTAAGTFFLTKVWLSSEFKPVQLSAGEERELNAKLEKLEPGGAKTPTGEKEDRLEPETYRETDEDREVTLTEREVNALIARNTDLARKVAVDLADDLVSIRLLVPVDEDFPFLGGQTLRLKAGVELAMEGGRPRVVPKGISLMGVPLPNAWIGGVKNIDLVREFEAEGGFWKTFADGVDHIRVKEGELRLRLRE